MPSNKSRDKKKLERTGKNEAIYPALSIVPALEKDKVIYKIMKITFTLKGECVTIEEVGRAKTEFEALVAFNNNLTEEIGNIMQMRNIIKELKEEKK